jgi:2-polyprenyl-3-methyl-5-hydroxy-6-metoxy-1,4-benzoquinol methylase
MIPTSAAIRTSAWSGSAGEETLRRMVSVDRYNRWIFERLAAFAGKHVLEVGCGIGNMTPFFLESAESMTCIDIHPESVVVMAAEFEGDVRLRAAVADIAEPTSVSQLGEARFDTVVCVNVLEHIERDGQALDNMRRALVPGGHVLLFVPAGQYLFGTLDEAVGHYRRYSESSLRRVVTEQGLEVVELFHMNVAGIPGWIFSGKILRRRVPPRGLLSLFNRIAPALISLEQLVKPRFGLSLVCIARRPG